MWLRRIVWLMIGIAVFATLIPANLRLYSDGSSAYAPEELGPDVLPRINALKSALAAGGAYQAETFFKDGCFLSYCFYGLSWVEIARRVRPGAELRKEAVREIVNTLNTLNSPNIRQRFVSNQTPACGIFYAAWVNRLRGGLLELQEPDLRDPDIAERFKADVARIADAYENSRTPWLERAPKEVQVADNVVAMSVLRLHDKLYSEKYKELVDNWLQRIKPTDPAELLASRFDAVTNRPLTGPRGISQGFILTFMNEIDPRFGRAQYERYRSLFYEPFWGFPLFLELPPNLVGTSTDEAEFGTLAGRSPTATLAALAAAQVNGDRQLADAIIQSYESLSLPITWSDEKSGFAGKIPFLDAMFLWAKTVSPWIDKWSNAGLRPIVAGTWRLPFQIISAIIAILMLVALRIAFRRPRKTEEEIADGRHNDEPDEPFETVRTHRTLTAIKSIHLPSHEPIEPFDTKEVTPSEPEPTPPAVPPMFRRPGDTLHLPSSQPPTDIPAPLFRRKRDNE